MNVNRIKTRFCPSPTGMLHLGNVRTALFNALFAKQQKGIFLLRIEDTDRLRSKGEYTQALQVDLKWLGLQWNEGPGDEGDIVPSGEGDAGPYFQSQRQSFYDRYYRELEEKELAYPCFCSEAQLSLARKIQRASGKPPRYPGTCRNLTKEEVAQKIAQGLRPTLRFRIVQDEMTLFLDLVKKEQRFNNNDIGDFIIRRADGTPPFMFCNAIDDALMGVTHALRGEDHLTNAPRQIMILRALNLPVPIYGHISLILGHDGTPLSKRHGSCSVQEMREQGYQPEAIINYLSRLGHHYVDENLMSFDELSMKFSIDALSSSPARFDQNQLLYWQRMAVFHSTEKQLWQWLGQNVCALIPKQHQALFIECVRNNILFPTDALHWANIFYSDEFALGSENLQMILQAGAQFFEVALAMIQTCGVDFHAVVDGLKKQLKIKGKALFQPLRVALTGELSGPEMTHVFELLGLEKMIIRFGMARELCLAHHS